MGFDVIGGSEVLSDRYVNVPDQLKGPISMGDENRVTFWHLEEETGFMTIAEASMRKDGFEFYDSTVMSVTKSGNGRRARPPKDLFTDYEYSFEPGKQALFLSTPDIDLGATYLITVDHLNDLFNQIISIHTADDEVPSSIIAEAMSDVRRRRELTDTEEDVAELLTDASLQIDSLSLFYKIIEEHGDWPVPLSSLAFFVVDQGTDEKLDTASEKEALLRLLAER